jgi:hypothetical protein
LETRKVFLKSDIESLIVRIGNDNAKRKKKMKKYAEDFVRQIEDQKKNYSSLDYLDMMLELAEKLEAKKAELEKELFNAND